LFVCIRHVYTHVAREYCRNDADASARVREARTEEVQAFAESMHGHLLAAMAAVGDTDRKV
jgi:hypothetical protein